MSYVIQNYSRYVDKITTTPRFKTSLILKSFYFFLFFFRSPKTTQTQKATSTLFKFFFLNGLHNFFYKSYTPLSANYTNRIKNTTAYLTFKTLDNIIYCKKFNNIFFFFNNFFFFNTYLLSIKVNNIKITNFFFKSTFFFFLFLNSFFWYQHHTHVFFYLNFFFYMRTLKFYKFYGGYFFKIYNF